MQQPAPHIDDDGNRYYNVRQAAQIIEGVCEVTLWRWASKGVTSFGFKLDVAQVPMTHPPGHSRNAKNPRKSRMLLTESDVLDLREILREGRKTCSGPWSPAEIDRLEATATEFQRRRSRKLTILHPA